MRDKQAQKLYEKKRAKHELKRKRKRRALSAHAIGNKMYRAWHVPAPVIKRPKPVPIEAKKSGVKAPILPLFLSRLFGRKG